MQENKPIDKTHLECVTFLSLARMYRTAPEIETKLDYAIDKMMTKTTKACTPSEEVYNETIEDLRTDYASVYPATDKKDYREGNLIIENGAFSYTPQKRKDLGNAIRAADKTLQATPISITPHIATKIPKNLSYEQVEAFRGFVLPEDYELPEPE